MESAGDDDYIERFVIELLRTGSMLTQLVADLVDALPPDAYPREDPASVVVEMVCGTIRTALLETNQSDLQRAAELIEQAGARVLEHLRLALHLSRRIEGDASGAGPAYG